MGHISQIGLGRGERLEGGFADQVGLNSEDRRQENTPGRIKV